MCSAEAGFGVALFISSVSLMQLGALSATLLQHAPTLPAVVQPTAMLTSLEGPCRLMAEYLEWAPASALAEAVEMLAGPPLLHCVHSRPGMQVACHVLAAGSAKQRKKVIKAMKGAALLGPSPAIAASCLAAST